MNSKPVFIFNNTSGFFGKLNLRVKKVNTDNKGKYLNLKIRKNITL